MTLLHYKMEDEELPPEMQERTEHLLVCCLQPPPKKDHELQWAKNVLREKQLTTSGNLEWHDVQFKDDRNAIILGINRGLHPPPPGTCQEGEWPPKLYFPAVLMCGTGSLTWNVVALANNGPSVGRLLHIMTSLVHQIHANSDAVPLSLQPAHQYLKAMAFLAVYVLPKQLSQDPAILVYPAWHPRKQYPRKQPSQDLAEAQATNTQWESVD